MKRKTDYCRKRYQKDLEAFDGRIPKIGRKAGSAPIDMRLIPFCNLDFDQSVFGARIELLQLLFTLVNLRAAC